MRKFIFIVGLWLGVAFASSAENFTLVDGAVITGELYKPDDSGLTIKTPEETFTNIAWARISQETLKQLVSNPKIKPLAEPFIEVDAAQRAQRAQSAEVKINSVARMERPANPSLFGGLFTSSLGLFLLLLVYAANLFAAYETSIVKARSAAQVMGLAAVLPIIGPAIFLVMKMKLPETEPTADEALAAEVAAAQKTPEEIQIAEASWKPQAEKKPEAQIFSRGKFTFNKRFLETRFGDFTGTAAGPLAQKFTMEARSMRETLAVERIAQIGQNEVIFETAKGQVTVPFSDLQEIKLNPKTT